MSDRADRVAVAARALRDHVARRLALERRQLAALEHEARALQDEISLMERSEGRRLLLGARARAVDVATAARHPVWAARTLARAAAGRQPLRDAIVAIRHLRSRSLPLRFSAPAGHRTDQPSEAEAIRWVGPISIRGEVFEALLCHPSSTVEYRTRVRAGARFVTACAISPQVWRHRPGPAEFRIRIHIPSTGWSATREVRLDVSRWLDRAWKPVVTQLPEGTSPPEVVVTLETTVAAGGNGGYCWTIFGDPRFEWARPAAEIRQSLAAFMTRVHAGGVRDAIAAVRRAPSAEETATIYARWVEANTLTPEAIAALSAHVAALPYQPLISVVTPVYNTDPRWLLAAVDSVRRQVYLNREHILVDDASTSPATIAALRGIEGQPGIHVIRLTKNSGISLASEAGVEHASGEFIALLDHDDELTPDALAEVAIWINRHPETDVLYSDEDKIDIDGTRGDVFFKPDWSPEHFLHCMYTCHMFVARRRLIREAGGFRKGYEGAQDYDLMLRLMERTARIGHIPRVLYHWRKVPQSTAASQSAKPWAEDAGRRALADYVRRQQLDAEVASGGAAGLFRIKRRIAGVPLVSIVIPTTGKLRNRTEGPADLLAEAIASVVRRTTYTHYEFIVIADESGVQQTTQQALAGTRHRVLIHRSPGPFNFSRKINEGVAAAAGEQILLFNDDLEVINGEWLAAMLEYSQDPAIGAVGPKLLYPDGRLQHVGMILGVNGVAAHAYHQQPGTLAGYFGSIIGPRNYSAVTGACLLTRRQVFNEVGGFDETFPIDFNDVDYCLRVRRAGYRIVYTPYARLCHHESASFGARQQDPEAIAEMRRRWTNEIERDPYYNPNLTREFPDYRLKPPSFDR